MTEPSPQIPVGAGDPPSPAPTGPSDWMAVSYLLRVMAHYAQLAANGRNLTYRLRGSNEVRKLARDLHRRLHRLDEST
ncbi:MAG: hypothetical protein ACRDRL_23600 [Sciscionella sp.]